MVNDPQQSWDGQWKVAFPWGCISYTKMLLQRRQDHPSPACSGAHLGSPWGLGLQPPHTSAVHVNSDVPYPEGEAGELNN